MTSFGAVLDANVLMMAGPRDTLLRAAEAGLYRPYWSERILGEVRRNLIELLTRRGRADPDVAVSYLIDEMCGQFPEAMVEGYEPLIPVMTNEERDRHVLAAAVVCRAQVIVTENLGDFPPPRWSPTGWRRSRWTRSSPTCSIWIRRRWCASSPSKVPT